MKLFVICFLLIKFFFISRAMAVEARPTLTIEGSAATLTVDLGGGSFPAFKLAGNEINPLDWDSWSFGSDPETRSQLQPRSMGHFLCLDRWGSASDAEKANGMTNHGEASQVLWEVTRHPISRGGVIEAALSARLPMAGLRVERSIRMPENLPVVSVTESVINTNPIGRIFNIVQHPSIGGPFLTKETIVDTNATRGFMQDSPMPNPEIPEVTWPMAKAGDGSPVDIRFLDDNHQPAVVSFVLDEELGWITASSPTTGLLIGYIWKSADFPWVNVWRNTRDGKPFARGLEFGTTGLHRPGRDLVEKGKIFDRALYRYIDASESQTFTYSFFLMEIPHDFAGVASVKYSDAKLKVVESGRKQRVYERNVGELF